MKDIQKIASFTVDHNTLLPGIYVSRVDGDVVTYDLRTRLPNSDDLMDHSTMHTFEHLFATYVRNSSIGKDVLYFGPMGCQTGFYLLVRGADNGSVLQTVKDVLARILAHEGEVFGNSATECGNYRTLCLAKGQAEAARYLAVLNQKEEWSFCYE